MLVVFSLYDETDTYSESFIENYAKINLIPQVQRVQGVGDANVLGQDYSMRIWLRPDVMAQYKLVPSDVSTALAEQNVEAAPGQFGERSNQTFQYPIRYKGRLQQPEEFENIVIKSLPDGEVLRLKDIAEIQLDRLGYNFTNRVDGHKSVTCIVYQMAGTNATQTISDIEQLLDEALTVANQSDIIIAALGESSEMSGESSSRTDLNIPDVQQNLLKELLKTGKPVVLVLFTGRPLTLTWEQEHVPAILNVWFGGSEAAYAIGDALFGYVNPGGKLTMSFPKNVGQIPLYYAHKNTGRPLAQGKWFEKFRSNYLDVDNEPLYPFGYGLSYTTFSYGDIDLSRSTIDMTGELTAAVMVTNTGTWPGSEVVQLYIRDLVGSTTRPVKELKGFQKIFLEPGQSEIVRFKIAPEMLRYYNYDLQLVAEPGEFEVMIGTNSRDVKSARFTLK